MSADVQSEALRNFIISMTDVKDAVDLYFKETDGQTSSSSQPHIDIGKERLLANYKQLDSSWRRLIHITKTFMEMPFLENNIEILPLSIDCRQRVKRVQDLLANWSSPSDISILSPIEEIESRTVTLIENIAYATSVQIFLTPDLNKPEDVV